MPMSESTRQRIDDLVRNHRVVLFMKGSRQFPQCGFSARVVQILNGFDCSYHTVNVLIDPELREGIKEYSKWPTIPQLYVDGMFLGGCDIVTDLFSSGELKQCIDAPKHRVETSPPPGPPPAQ